MKARTLSKELGPEPRVRSAFAPRVFWAAVFAVSALASRASAQEPEEKSGDVVIEYVPPPAPSEQPATTQPTPTEPAPSAQPTAPEQGAPAPPPADEGKRRRVTFRGEGGFQYAQVVGVPITGARVRLGVGTQNDSLANYGTFSLLYGGTENDLRVWDFHFGYTGDFLKVSILRLGLDADVGYLVIHRATLNDRMFALGLGAGAHAGFDLFAFGSRNDHAVTAQARFDASIHFGGAFVWGPAVLVGFRY